MTVEVRCPSCSAVYRVHPNQLDRAHGFVRCGTCYRTFDARAAAVAPDEPPPESEPTYPRARADEIPSVIRDDLVRLQAEAVARRRAIGYGIASAVLAIVLAVQYAWFAPEDVGRRYPLARPWLESFCAHAGCRLADRREPERIHVLERDVRVHPRYEGALQITATLVNTAAHAQEYPRMRFTLFNVNGQTIATRSFAPSEYLSADIDPNGRLEPNRPLQIALELLAPEQVAVSFEFVFL